VLLASLALPAPEIGDIRHPSMEPITNSAGRLFNILHDAKQKVPNQVITASKLWAEVFALDQGTPDFEVHIFERLLQLRQLIIDAERDLRGIGISDKMLRPFERIKPIPQQSLSYLNSDIRNTIQAVTESDMTLLEVCSEELEKRHLEPAVDEAELHEILADLRVIFDEVTSGSIDPDLKLFILDGLETIQRGILEFRIRGHQRLNETIGEIVASFVANHPIPKTAEDEDSWRKFNKVFRRVVAVAHFTITGIREIQAFAGVLTSGEPPSSH
jgi:hypothetical protein